MLTMCPTVLYVSQLRCTLQANIKRLTWLFNFTLDELAGTPETQFRHQQLKHRLPIICLLTNNMPRAS